LPMTHRHPDAEMRSGRRASVTSQQPRHPAICATRDDEGLQTAVRNSRVRVAAFRSSRLWASTYASSRDAAEHAALLGTGLRSDAAAAPPATRLVTPGRAPGGGGRSARTSVATRHRMERLCTSWARENPPSERTGGMRGG
jgi:hypothetical protein